MNYTYISSGRAAASVESSAASMAAPSADAMWTTMGQQSEMAYGTYRTSQGIHKTSGNQKNSEQKTQNMKHMLLFFSCTRNGEILEKR